MRTLNFNVINKCSKNRTYYFKVDGKVILTFKTIKSFSHKVDNKSHLITIETDEKIKNYLLHVPTGKDSYDFEVTITDKETLII